MTWTWLIGIMDWFASPTDADVSAKFRKGSKLFIKISQRNTHVFTEGVSLSKTCPLFLNQAHCSRDVTNYPPFRPFSTMKICFSKVNVFFFWFEYACLFLEISTLFKKCKVLCML